MSKEFIRPVRRRRARQTISHGLKHHGTRKMFNRDRRDDAGPHPVRLRRLSPVRSGLVTPLASDDVRLGSDEGYPQ